MKMSANQSGNICQIYNKKILRQEFMGETFEAGIVLFGPGVKFLRIGVRR
jgi:tmRNA-binding protein